MQREVQCKECEGTGSSVPGCKLCKGHRSIEIKHAHAGGWKNSDLTGLDYGDGYCDCPRCDAVSCMFCEGDCIVEPIVNTQQEMRVLVYGLGGRIPPVFRTDFRGKFAPDDDMHLLSRSAVAACREKGLVSWFVSVFGDEVYLTPEGEVAARDAWKEYRKLCRRAIAAERDYRARIAALGTRTRGREAEGTSLETR